MRALSLELEILLELYANGAMSAGEIIARIHASQASFSVIARRLLQEGHVFATPGETDKRRTIYTISDKTRQIIMDCVAGSIAAASEAAHPEDSRSESASAMRSGIPA